MSSFIVIRPTMHNPTNDRANAVDHVDLVFFGVGWDWLPFLGVKKQH